MSSPLPPPGVPPATRRPGGAQAEHIDACLKFFIDSFEAWRAAMQVESMLLIAHSTGAFVAAHYALARPARLTRPGLPAVALIWMEPRRVLRRPAPHTPPCALSGAPGGSAVGNGAVAPHVT